MSNIFSERTQRLINFDILRYNARLKIGKSVFTVPTKKLHLGCQGKKIAGWLNVDVTASDMDIDIAGGYLPFNEKSFDTIVCQQTIEHLDIHEELIPLFKEIKRIASVGATLWLSCPDISKICSGYQSDKGLDLLDGKRRRYNYSQGTMPSQQVINAHFFQNGEHQNLFDLNLLQWTLSQAGITNIEQINEEIFLKNNPEFPLADDDDHSLYTKVTL